MKRSSMGSLFLVLAMLLLAGGIAAAMAEEGEASRSDMAQSYEDVLLGKTGYIQCNDADGTYDEAFMAEEIRQWYGYMFENPLRFEEFCVVDLDADGYPEIVLKLSNYFGFEALRYEGGQVYGFPFVYRAMEDVTQSGAIYASSGAGDNGWYQLRFDAEKMEMSDICWTRLDESNRLQYVIGDKAVSESEFEKFSDEIERSERPLWMEYTPANLSEALSSLVTEGNAR